MSAMEFINMSDLQAHAIEYRVAIPKTANENLALVIVSSVVLPPMKDLSGLNVCSVAPSSIVKPDRSGRKDDRRPKF